jgi:hypothetical protein
VKVTTTHIALLLISALALQSPTSARQASGVQPADDKAPQMLSIPFYQSAAQARVMVTIGDSLPTPMLFDTGTNGFDLDAPVAERMNLRVVDTGEAVDAATMKRVAVSVVAVPNFAVSGIPIGTVEANKNEPFDPNSVGVVGPYLFSGRLVTLEFGQSRMRVSDASNAPDGKAFPFIENLPAVPIDVAGIPIMSHFDSGADSDLGLPTRLMKSLSFIEPPVRSGQVTSMLGKQPEYRARIRGDVKIGPLVLHNPRVGFSGDRPYANVGLLILRQMTFAVDPKRQLTWLFDPKSDRLPMTAYAGRYGEFAVASGQGKLTLTRDPLPPATFVPLGSGLFEDREDGARIQFRREGRKSTGLWRISPKGRVTWADRTG